MLLKRSDVNLDQLEKRVLISKDDLKKSKDLSEPEKKVISYVFNQIIDGVDNHKFSTCCLNETISFFELQNNLQNVFVKMSFRHGDLIKAFQIEDFEEFKKKIEYYSEKIGFCFKESKKDKNSVVEFFLKG